MTWVSSKQVKKVSEKRVNLKSERIARDEREMKRGGVLINVMIKGLS